MERVDNYQIQARQARAYFLRYDQEALIKKLNLCADENYLHTRMLCKSYRIHRKTGDIQRLEEGNWVDANTFAEVMVLLDLVCDSREDRWLTGRWKNMQSFGLMFHRNLLENEKDPFAQAIWQNMDGFRAVCREMQGATIPGGDISFAIELFDGLRIGILFWEGDEEFYPRVRFHLDENALMYIKYETMHFAIGMLKTVILDKMKGLTA